MSIKKAAVIMGLISAVSLTACGSDNSSDTVTEETVVSEADTVTAETTEVTAEEAAEVEATTTEGDQVKLDNVLAAQDLTSVTLTACTKDEFLAQLEVAGFTDGTDDTAAYITEDDSWYDDFMSYSTDTAEIWYFDGDSASTAQIMSEELVSSAALKGVEVQEAYASDNAYIGIGASSERYTSVVIFRCDDIVVCGSGAYEDIEALWQAEYAMFTGPADTEAVTEAATEAAETITVETEESTETAATETTSAAE